MRTDIHNLKNLDPKDYTPINVFYQGCSTDDEKIGSMEEEIAAMVNLNQTGIKSLNEDKQFSGNFKRGCTCDHCGHHFNYGVIFEHVSGEQIVVGWICGTKIYQFDSRFKMDMASLKKRVAIQRERQKMATVANAFLAQHAGLAEALECDNYITKDIKAGLYKYGKLSDKQIALVFKLVEDTKKRNEAKAEIDAKKKPFNRALIGQKITITGTVLYTKTVESQFGTSIKMGVWDASRGSTFYGTVPSNLLGEITKGDVIMLNVSISDVSDKDSSFVFYKRPTKATCKRIEDMLAAEIKRWAEIDKNPANVIW